MTNIISIAVLMFCIQLSIGAIATFDLFGPSTITPITGPPTYDPNATINGWNLGGYGSVATFAVLSIFASIGLLFAVFYTWLGIAMIALPMATYIAELLPGVFPPVMLAILTAIVGMVLLLGAISMVTGRSRRLGNE